MAREQYTFNVVKAVNGWIVSLNGGPDGSETYIVPEDGDLGGQIVAAMAARRLSGDDKQPNVQPQLGKLLAQQRTISNLKAKGQTVESFLEEIEAKF